MLAHVLQRLTIAFLAVTNRHLLPEKRNVLQQHLAVHLRYLNLAG